MAKQIASDRRSLLSRCQLANSASPPRASSFALQIVFCARRLWLPRRWRWILPHSGPAAGQVDEQPKTRLQGQGLQQRGAPTKRNQDEGKGREMSRVET